MSDSRRQYRAIRKAVKQLYPSEPRGTADNRHVARHLETLVFTRTCSAGGAGVISGIIATP
jgi:hypothetical protein